MVEQSGGTSGAGAGGAPADNRGNSPFHQPARPYENPSPGMPAERLTPTQYSLLDDNAVRNRYAQVRGVDGQPEFKLRDDLGRPRGEQRQREPVQSIFAEPADANAPKLKLSDGTELAEADIRAALAEKSARDARKATSDPANYRVELPADFQKPAGLDFKFDEKDAVTAGALASARALAAEYSIDEPGFQKMLSIWAGAKFAEISRLNSAFAAEKAALGPAGAARITNISNWLDAMGAGEAKKMLVTSKIVDAIERLLTKHSSQGSAGFSQSGREQPESGLSDAKYNAMTPREKMDYARMHDQSPFQDNR